uniref:Uncharacterized protein n=1 Tax=Latimeria chalumnae TaxID=7897 RepID=H3B9B3_LATCH
ICIFCDKSIKYIKGSKSREPLKKSHELPSDDRIRSVVIKRMDKKILSITSRELVAAEAHYHKSCLINYTRQRPAPLAHTVESDNADLSYSNAEMTVYDMLFDHIRKTIFPEPHVVSMVELTEKLISFMNSLGVAAVKVHTKHIRRKLEGEFGDSLQIFPSDRLLIVPNNLTVQTLAKEYIKPKIATAEPPKPKAPIQKEKKRSITPTPLFLPHYNAGDHNTFRRIPVDQAIEETVNKDTQTAGGTKGFSLKPAAVSKYYLTAEYGSTCLKQLHDMIELQSPGLSYADLEPSCIQKDEADVQSLVDLLENNWTNPFSSNSSDLVSISTGMAAPPDFTHDLLKAQDQGEKAYQNFQYDRLETGSQHFHYRLLKLKLKTFSSLKKQRRTKMMNKAYHRLFGQLVLIATNRNLHMHEVLQPPLGPLPWMHLYTGCDTVSASANHSKLSALKLLLGNRKFQDAFTNLGQQWFLSAKMF